MKKQYGSVTLEKVRITVVYNDGCFCQRPELVQGKPFNCYPRFNFRKEAEKLANIIGASITWYSAKDKVAIGALPFACTHRQEQSVRFSWE